MPDNQNLMVIAVILCMAGATYFTRAGGLFIVSRINPSPRFRAFLAHMPSSILVAIIVPPLINQGPSELMAAALTGIVAVMTRNLIFSLLSGLIAVSMLRNFVFI